MQIDERANTKLNGTAERLKVPILTYHSIDESGSVISIRPDVFRWQMRSLAEAGYNAISLCDLISVFKNSGHLPQGTVVLTFDDGFQNFYTHAFPVLSEHNFKATVFLVTNFCGKHNDWAGNPPELGRSKLLSWDEIRELNRYGIEFGSHTRTHADLTKIPTIEAEAEMSGSKASIEDILGYSVTTFAYPFGRYDSDVKRLTKDNFSAACSTNLGKVYDKSDVYSLRRIDSYYLSNQKLFNMLASTSFDQYMRLRQAMRTVKSLIYWN